MKIKRHYNSLKLPREARCSLDGTLNLILNFVVAIALLERVVVERVEADALRDLGHALLVGSCDTDGAEDFVHLLERETLGLRYEEPDKEAADKGECLSKSKGQ